MHIFLRNQTKSKPLKLKNKSKKVPLLSSEEELEKEKSRPEIAEDEEVTARAIKVND